MKGDNEVCRCTSQLATSLLFVEARQLLPNVLICGVEGSVDFLQVEKKTLREALISSMKFVINSSALK